MKVVDCGRARLYDIVGEVFAAAGRRPAMIELGVHKGDNALRLMEALRPRHSVLVDAWSAEALATYSHFDKLPPWILPLTAFERYFGGSLSDQATFDRTYETACQRFDGRSDVEIIRADTISGFAQVRDRHGDGAFDFIYVDANHQYECAARPALLPAPAVGRRRDDAERLLPQPEGHEPEPRRAGGRRKLHEAGGFHAVALTSTDMSDLIIAREGSAVAKALDAAIDASDIGFVEVMPQMLPAAHIRVSPAGKTRVSFAKGRAAAGG